MNKLAQILKNEYGYSNYDLALVKYTLLSIWSEASKIILLAVFYFFMGKFTFFISFVILLTFLRLNSGGFHCKHYITCLLLTFAFSYTAIIILPELVVLDTLKIEVLTIICLFTNYFIGPIASPFRPSPNSILLKHCNNNSFIVIFIFFITVSIFNSNNLIHPYLIVCFWTIILHTFQMITAKILLIKGGEK